MGGWGPQEDMNDEENDSPNEENPPCPTVPIPVAGIPPLNTTVSVPSVLGGCWWVSGDVSGSRQLAALVDVAASGPPPRTGNARSPSPRGCHLTPVPRVPWRIRIE